MMRLRQLLMLMIMLCVGAFGLSSASAATEADLADYAKVTATLHADASGTPLPGYVENGQSLFFRLKMSQFDSQALIALLKAGSPVDLLVELGFTGEINGAYPTEMYPEDFDNVAVHDGQALFRWWVEDGKIHIRFDDEWIRNATSASTIDAAELGFTGAINVQSKPEDGQVVFTAGGQSFPLQFRTGYSLTKSATAPLYRNGQYEVDYTVVFTLDQSMNITGGEDADHYSALLTLQDTLAASGSALTGEIVGTPALTGPVTGLKVAAVRSGTVNTFSISGSDVLPKGAYTLTYTMLVDSAAAAARLSGYDKVNTAELMENGASLKSDGVADPLTAQATIAWSNELSNRFKVDKCLVNQNGNSVVYRVGSEYYADYYLVVYTREEISSLTVVDQIVSNAVHTAHLPVTLLGVNTAEGFWDRAAVSGLPALTAVNAAVSAPISGSERAITLTANDGILPAGAYYMKVPVRLTDAVLSLAASAQNEVGANTTGDASIQFRNKAILDVVNGDSSINETTKEITGTINGPSSFIKRGAIEMDTSGNYIIYDKEGVRGKLIRWDVTFDWSVPNADTVITDTMKGGQTLLVNGSTSFDIWDMTSGTAVSISQLWSKTDTSYIDFGTDAEGNETFTFYPGRLSANVQDSTRKFKVSYYTLVPEETVDFSPMSNSWTVKYADSGVPGAAVGPVTGQSDPQLGESVRLDLTKKWKYFVNDYVTQWEIVIKNSAKIPFDSLSKLVLVDIPSASGSNAFAEGEVWIDHDRMLTDLPLEIWVYASNGKHEALELGTHYTISKTHPDYDLGTDGRGGFALEFNVPAMKALMKKHNASFFASIGIACYVHNADKAAGSGKTWSVTNDAYLDYAVAGMELPDEDATDYTNRQFSTISKTVGSTENGQRVVYHDYDGDGDKEVRWELVVAANEFKSHPDPLTITITDTLPAEMTLDGVAGEGWKTAFRLWAKNDASGKAVIDLTDPKYAAAFSLDERTNTFTLSFVKPGGDWAKAMGASGAWVSTDIAIRYHTIFKPGALQNALDKAGSSAVTVSVPLSNSASVEWMGNVNDTPSASADACVSDVLLDKTARWLPSAGNKVRYTIDVNPYSLTLGDGGVLHLQDALGEGKEDFVYLDSSFTLVNTATGVQLARADSVSANSYALTMAEDGKSFTVDLPDGAPLRLSYQVKTTKPVGTKDVSLLNSVSLEGRTVTPVEIVFDVNSSYQSGSFTLQDGEVGVRILKVDSRQADAETMTGLPGAVFTVTEVDVAGQPVGQPVALTTDSDGMITIVEAPSIAKILLIEETQAPTGFMLDEEPWKWCYVLVPEGMHPGSVPDELAILLDCSVTVINAGSYADEVVTNDPVAVTISKENADGDPLFGAEFELKKADGTVVQPDADSVAGTLKFSGLTAGEYTLTETQAPAGYMLSGESTWRFTVAEDGSVSLPSDITYTLLNQDGARLTVVNESQVVSASFSGTKTVNGVAPADKRFSFVLADEAGNTLETVENTEDGSIAFTAISYDASDVGVHTYTVTESAGTQGGVTYDETVYTVTVTVAIDGDGTLMATVSANAAALDFVNAYAATGDVQFSGSKTLNGKTLEAGQFSFELRDEAGNVLETVQNAADGSFSFTALEYELADAGQTYTYTVQEVAGSLPGVTYDGTVYTVTVEVTDNGDGTLMATASANAVALDFVNAYAATGDVQFSGSKTLNGKTLEAGQFSFELRDEAGNVLETVQNAADGSFSFTALEYELADAGQTYTYTVQEVAGSLPGVTYDGTVYTVTVEVTDNGDGTLMATASANAAALGFTNTFTATGEIPLTASKTVNGAAPADDEVFSFVLADENGMVLQTVQNTGGEVVFEALAFDQGDVGQTFVYTVCEAEDSRPYYTSDDRVYTVKVTVGLDEADALELTQEILCGGERAAEIVFDNIYEASGSLQLTAQKTVNGATPEAGRAYEFLLEGEGVAMTAANEGESVVFDEMTYDLSDAGKTYAYTVRETTASAGTMTADASVYTVTVTIVDNRDGTLTASPIVTLAGNEVSAITFNNIIDAPLTITKKVAGCDTAETFTFTVRFYYADGTEATEPVRCTGDLSGEFISGDSIEMGHNQSVTFTGLQPGMRYTVEEEGNIAFTTTVNGLPMSRVEGESVEGGNRADFVNTLRTTSFSVMKAWEGLTSGDIVLTLYANGEKLNPQPDYTRDGDRYSYAGLPMYDADGTPVVYAAKEKYMDGCLTIYENVGAFAEESRMVYDGGTIINRAVVSVRVQKVWSGLAEDEAAPEITLTLCRNGEPMDKAQPTPDENGWYTYRNLPRYYRGEVAEYYVVEEPLAGYRVSYADADGQPAECAYDGYTMTNHKIPATGDNASLMLWAAALAGSAAALMLMLKRRQRGA